MATGIATELAAEIRALVMPAEIMMPRSKMKVAGLLIYHSSVGIVNGELFAVSTSLTRPPILGKIS